jgi:hypothetical protein
MVYTLLANLFVWLVAVEETSPLWNHFCCKQQALEEETWNISTIFKSEVTVIKFLHS